jgi:membrane protein DedA with SNARE-associated domain
MEHSLALVNEFLDSLFAHGPLWIYMALFTASFIENIFPPFPGDFFTLAGGALAAAGRIDIFAVYAAASIGGLSSSMLLYYLGRAYGREFFLKKDFRFFSARDIRNLEVWFQKRGVLLLLGNRFLVGARAIVILTSGISRYNTLKTLASIGLSFCLFNALLLFGTYLFVINFDTMAEIYRHYEKIVLPVVVLIIILLLAARVYKVFGKRE